MVAKKKTATRLLGAQRRDKSLVTLVGFGKFDKDGFLPLAHIARGGKVRPCPGDTVEISARVGGVMTPLLVRPRAGLSDEELIHRTLIAHLGQTGGMELATEEVAVEKPAKAKPAVTPIRPGTVKDKEK